MPHGPMSLEIPTPDDVKRERFKTGLTQGDVAEKADMSQAMVSRIERGDVDPTLSTLRELARVINDEQ